MKTLMVLLIAVGCSQTSIAQSPFSKLKPIEDNKLKRLLTDTLRFIKPQILPDLNNYNLPMSGVLMSPLKGTFVMENNKGDEIYKMELDNMACLVPNKTFVDKMAVPNIQNTENDRFLLKRNNGVQSSVK